MAIERIGTVLLAALVLIAPACRSRKQTGEVEDAPGMVSVLPMNDGHARKQLVSGFYQVESGVWRWTGPKFSVNLQPPAQSATQGAKLALKLVIPDVVIQKLNVLTLSAKVGDTSLPPETYNKPGDYTYTRDVPSSALQANAVRVDFWLDKAMPGTAGDQRQLGVVVQQVGLTPK